MLELERGAEQLGFASVKRNEHAFKRRAEMDIKYALATTSVLALLAGPALAQAPV